MIFGRVDWPKFMLRFVVGHFVKQSLKPTTLKLVAINSTKQLLIIDYCFMSQIELKLLRKHHLNYFIMSILEGYFILKTIIAVIKYSAHLMCFESMILVRPNFTTTKQLPLLELMQFIAQNYSQL